MINELKQEMIREKIKVSCRNEIAKIVNDFWGNDRNNITTYPNQKESLENIYCFLKNINSFEKPDAYSLVDNNILIIEHFEFDSSENNKKGSENRKEKACIDRKFKNALQKVDLKYGETFYKHDKFDVSYSMDNYINNALKGLKNHYEKIDSYKQNLLDKGIIDRNTNVKTMFWIEDTTPLGNIIIPEDIENGSNPKPLILLYCDKFLEELKKCDKLDYIFCFSHYGENKFCYFLDMNYLQDYISEQIKVDETRITDFKPHTIGFMTMFDCNEVQNETRNKTEN